jgi:dihydrofolate synthase / folylpolyglutamate synthase
MHSPIRTYAEAEDYLHNYLSRTAPSRWRNKKGLERAAHYFHLLGDPQNEVQTIHVAGTSGKGSVCYILTVLLEAHGFRIGRFVSPTIYSPDERWTVDGKPLAHKEIIDHINTIIPAASQMAEEDYGRPTLFETTNAVSFLANRQHKVDYAIIETGLGGLYDSTNTITRSDKLAVITRLGHDHMAVLGTTLRQIAYQKAGIIPYNGTALVLRPANRGARKSIEETARHRQAHVIYLRPDLAAKVELNLQPIFDYVGARLTIPQLRLNLTGAHQIENATIALRTLEYLSERDHFEIDVRAVRQALASVKVPGRAERRQWRGHTVLLDGAHNPQKMRALCIMLEQSFPVPPLVIVAFKEDKAIGSVLRELRSCNDGIIATQFTTTKGYSHFKGVSPELVVTVARRVGITNVRAAETPTEALRLAATLLKPHQPLVITGSMYLLGEVAELL